MNRYIFLILLVFSPLEVFSPEQKPTIQETVIVPIPTDLSPKWWDYFSVPQDELEERIHRFVSSLEETVSRAPESSKEKTQDLVERITNGLNGYLTTIKQKPEPLAPPSPFESSYSVGSLMEIHKRLRNKRTLLQANLSEQKDLKGQIETGTQSLERLNSLYRSREPRSEEKLISGLHLISFQISLQTAKERLDDLKQEIGMNEEEIKRIKAEEEAAIARLHTDPKEIEHNQKELEEAQTKFEEIEKKLNLLRNESISAFSFWHQTYDEKLNDQMLQLNILDMAIQAASAENQLILKKIQEALIRFLSAQDTGIDISEKSRQLAKQLSNLTEKITGWGREVDRFLLRIEEILPFDEELPQKTLQLQKEALQKTQNIELNIQRLKQEINDSQFLLEVLDKKFFTYQGGLSKWILQTYGFVITMTDKAVESITRAIFYIGTTPITPLNIFTFILILMATFWISRLTRMTVRRISVGQRGARPALIYRVNRLIHYSILIIGIIFALTFIGFDFSNLMLIAGALGVGIGFGLQSIVNNFFCGLILLFESQLKVGDYIEIGGGIRGEVKEINFRSTYIQTNDGMAIIVPNSEFINQKVINWTLKDPYRRLRIPFSVSYDTDKDLVCRIVEEAAKTVPTTLQKDGVPPPKVYIKELAPSGINFELGVWVDPKATKKTFSTASLYLWAIHDALKKHGISIPYPQQTIHFADPNIEVKKTTEES